MEREKIGFTAEGFLRSSIYIKDLPNLLDEYKDKFGDAESLVVNLKDNIIGNKPTSESVIFSNDGKKIEINIFESKEKEKGKLINPSADSVYQVIKFVLERAVKEYSEKFPPVE